jgi:hypothetical protein
MEFSPRFNHNLIVWANFTSNDNKIFINAIHNFKYKCRIKKPNRKPKAFRLIVSRIAKENVSNLIAFIGVVSKC